MPTNQLPLFNESGGAAFEVEAVLEVAAPYEPTSETSKAAAEEIDRINKGGKREYQLLEVLQIREAYGITETEAQIAFEWSGDYERPAMRCLRDNGLAVKSGSKRLNIRDNPCEIWIVTELGMTVNCKKHLYRIELETKGE